jgi:putative transcriptional regulator
MAKFSLDPDRPPELSPAERKRLESFTEARITAAARDDADNEPLTKDELGKVRSARLVRRARAHTGLSQAAFASTYRINAARLRDLEQGRTQADSALLAYLTVIEKDPEAVRRALEG